MPLFVLMTKLAPESLHDAPGRRTMGEEWIAEVKRICPEVRFVGHYALLGPYDFMDIYEAPDIETASRVSLVSRARGAVEAESWPALPYSAFLEELARVEAN